MLQVNVDQLADADFSEGFHSSVRDANTAQEFVTSLYVTQPAGMPVEVVVSVWCMVMHGQECIDYGVILRRGNTRIEPVADPKTVIPDIYDLVASHAQLRGMVREFFAGVREVAV